MSEKRESSENKPDNRQSDTVRQKAVRAPRKTVSTESGETGISSEKASSSRASASSKQSARTKTGNDAAQTPQNRKPAEKPVAVETYVKQKLAENIAAEEESAQPDMDAIKKQFKKKKTAVPSYGSVTRYTPDVNSGLSAAQVNERFSQFLFNDVNIPNRMRVFS